MVIAVSGLLGSELLYLHINIEWFEQLYVLVVVVGLYEKFLDCNLYYMLLTYFL